MRPYSMDLRKRVIEAYERGEDTQAELAERFGVSVSWVEKLVRQWRESNSIAPKPHGGGRSAIVRGQALERLKAYVEQHPGATLEELRRGCRISGSIMCVFRALQRLGITRKKSPSATSNY